ncbi:hypothetical protein BHE74_00031052 [Ensete ventricosum]|nr:hypothetical protein BHE74_00031052 [Ensete ventricosum]
MNQRSESNSSLPAASSGRQIHATRTRHLYQNTKHLFNFETTPPPRKRIKLSLQNQSFTDDSPEMKLDAAAHPTKAAKRTACSGIFRFRSISKSLTAASDPLKERKEGEREREDREKRKPNQQAERKNRTKRDATSSVFRHRVRPDQNIAEIWSKEKRPDQ